MKNPPRTTKIRGQKHLLAYITPDEAKLLKAMGGSGEKVNGIPAFVRGFGGETSEQEARDSGAGGISRDDVDRGNQDASDRQAERDLDRQIADEIKNRQEYEAKIGIGGISPGQATAMFGDATMAGKGFTSADIDRMLGSASVDVTGILPELQRRARRSSQFSTLGKILSPARMLFENVLGMPKGPTAYDNLATLIGMPGSTIMSGGLLGPDAVLGVPTGGIGAFGTPANLSQNYLGHIVYTGQPNEDYTGPFQDLVRPDDDRLGGDGPDTVPATTNPVTGEQQCPDGYVFDNDLQACRLAGGLPGGDGQVMTTSGPYEAGDYARMGLLDIAPMGMGLFADRYGAGFGTPSDFSTANLAFRRGAATRPQYFRQAPDLTGYTLLS